MSADGEVIVAFADLVGYTAATETHGDQLAASLSMRLSQLASGSLGGDGRLVKTVADEVMLVGAGPGLFDSIRRLLTAVACEHDFPLIRVGAHVGPVIEQEGDLFGATVNVASRIIDQAEPMQTLISKHGWDALAGAVSGRSIGSRSLRNVSHEVELFELDLGFRSGHWWVDPVCRMRVDRPSLRTIRDGVTYAFCSDACKERFITR